MKRLYLYYPCPWKDIASQTDTKFNWFLCGKKYRDDRGNTVVDMAPGTQFYEPETGMTYTLPFKEPDEPKDTVLLVDREVDHIPYPYSGIAFSGQKECLMDTLCTSVVFVFRPEVIVPISNQSRCKLILYAKTNYDELVKKYPDFPTPEEIDETLKYYPCTTVCRVLYSMVENRNV